MHGEAESKFDVADQIVAFKRSMTPRREALKRAFGEVKDHVSRAAYAIREDTAAGRPVVPEVEYRDIRSGSIAEGTRQVIRRAGCAVVRGVFPESVASDWFAELDEYLKTNNYEQREVEKRSLDKYFSALKAGKPQIFNIYWSKPQVMARQDPKLAETLRVPRSPVDLRRRVRSRQSVHLCGPGAPPAARRQDAGPLAAHGRWHRRTLDRSRLPESLRERLRRGLAPLQSIRRDTPVEDARAPLARRSAACSAPIRAGRR